MSYIAVPSHYDSSCILAFRILSSNLLQFSCNTLERALSTAVCRNLTQTRPSHRSIYHTIYHDLSISIRVFEVFEQIVSRSSHPQIFSSKAYHFSKDAAFFTSCALLKDLPILTRGACSFGLSCVPYTELRMAKNSLPLDSLNRRITMRNLSIKTTTISCVVWLQPRQL